ncbi:MAG: transcription termination factor Rho [Myxococcales bacterium]
MSNETNEGATSAPPPAPHAEGGAPREGGGEASGAPMANGHGNGMGADAGQGGQPGQPGMPGEGRRRRRRRRRRRGGQGQPGEGGQVEGGQPQAQQGQPGGQGQPHQPPPQQHHGQQHQQQPQQQLVPGEGVLDWDNKGNFGYLRQLKRNMLVAPDDVEVPRGLIQRLRLRPGQFVQGMGVQRGGRVQLQRIELVDGEAPELAGSRPQFPDLTVVDPMRRIQLEHSHSDMVTRVLDLIAPIGFGQRGLIVAPPKTGKTIMLQRIAQSVTENHPRAHLMVLLVDERPEEVTDMRRSIKGEVLASSSDRPTSDHIQVAEMTLDRARRLVEQGKDVVILLDSITRLARAYNKEVESSGRTLTGGVDSRALERPKRIFGSARATEEAGSLTILGTALIETGSRMDEVIFEEFKGTGNMEVTLDRQLAERRIFPAVNIPGSGTRKEEKLMTPKEYEKVKKLRQMLFAMKPSDAMEKLVKKLAEFETNDEFLDAV